MEISVHDNYEELCRFVYRVFARRILSEARVTLGLATGNTPKRFYELLVDQYERGVLNFQDVITFNLDEYYPMDPDDPHSFVRYMREHLVDHVNLRQEHVHIPDGSTEDPEREAETYEKRIRDRGGIDLQLLGIAENGHIGFNEPGSDWESETRLVTLDQHTRERNFEDPEDAPSRAITMGIKTIMRSKHILLMAAGDHKADVLQKALEGPVRKEVPASVLQLHPQLTVALDRDAATALSI